MLIAAEKGASLIVSVGSQFNLVEFLDRNREGMSSTFLTRLRIGEILVDAKGVSRLYHPRPGLTPLLVVVVGGPARDDRRRLADPGAARRRRPALAQAPAARLSVFDYRYHALSLAAVLFALAVGVLIGVAIGDSNLVSSAKNGIVHNLESEVERRAGTCRDAADAAELRGSLRQRPLPARRPWPARRPQHRPGVPRRLLQRVERPRARAPSPRPAAIWRRSWRCASRST